MAAFQSLILSLPTRSSTMRMRVWPALKADGRAMLREGVYVLPADSPRAAVLAEMEEQVRSAGGFAMTAELALEKAEHLAELRGMFDRSKDYGGLVQEMLEARKLAPPRVRMKLQRLQ